MSTWRPRNFSGYMDFVAVVILGAPNEFMKHDFLRDDEQTTLDSAFEALFED